MKSLIHIDKLRTKQRSKLAEVYLSEGSRYFAKEPTCGKLA
jgi:hypothetical protein